MDRTLEFSVDKDNATSVSDLNAQKQTNRLAKVTHDIRNELSSILGMADLLSKAPLSDQDREYLKTLRSSANALAGMIEEGSQFLRVKLETPSVVSTSFGLTEVFLDVELALAETAPDLHLTLPTLGSAFPARLIGNAVYLKDILVDLIFNLAKHTGCSDIALGVELVTAIGNQIELVFTVSNAREKTASSTLSAHPFTIPPISSRFISMLGGTICADGAEGGTFVLAFTLRFLRDPDGGVRGERYLNRAIHSHWNGIGGTKIS